MGKVYDTAYKTEELGLTLGQEADYLLSVTGNQLTLKKDIANYIGDEQPRSAMDTLVVRKKNREHAECRTAFVTNDVARLDPERKWAGLRCIGAIHHRSQRNPVIQANGTITFPVNR